MISLMEICFVGDVMINEEIWNAWCSAEFLLWLYGDHFDIIIFVTSFNVFEYDKMVDII